MAEAEEFSWKSTLLYVAFLLYFWGWVLVNVPKLENVAIIYMFMTLLAVIIGGLAAAGVHPFAVLGFPPIQKISQTTFVGITIGLLWIFIGGLISQLQITIYQQLPPLIAFFFTFSIASTEEVLLRGTVLPSLVKLFKSKTVAIITTSLFFALLHWTVFQGTFSFLLSAFLFSIVISILTLHYGTAWVAGAAHITYNLIIVYNLVGVPF